MNDHSISADEAWAVYLANAVRRFEKWVKVVVARNTPSGASEENVAPWEEREIPPLDVIMVWHTYLLNPRIYYEDGLRLFRRSLLDREPFPLHHIATIMSSPPSTARVHHFEAYISEPFDQHLITESNVLKLQCPGCGRSTEVKWYKEDGTGYSQDGFSQGCSECRIGLSRENFGIARLAKDLAGIKRNPNQGSVAGVLLGPRSGSPNLTFTRAWNKNVLNGLVLYKAEDYAYAMGWNFREAANILKHGFNEPDESLPDYQNGMKRILKAYNTWTCFSVDLRAAVSRQFRFISKIAGLGWLEPGAFPADSKSDEGREESRALRRSVAQYHAFLDLMAVNPKKFLVPTLAIDLAWHTHQLFHAEYRKSTIALVGSLVDHDDAVEQENLASSYRQTAQLWHSRFNIPYSICGCPQPQISSLASASALASRVFSKSLFSSPKPMSSTPNPRPDLLQLSENALEETHPSEHPSVIVTNIPIVWKLRNQRLSSSEGKGKGKANETNSSNITDMWVDENETLRKKRERHRDDCPAFHVGFSNETSVASGSAIVNGATLGAADCIAGMGAMGACRAGNSKLRGMIEILSTVQEKHW
ncbi:hypothetical protein FRC03_009468 [Tulasnella sp. 419]|nr:hypothetical protein FRC03_009468 [Tulasnella sp. 419]